MKNLDNYDDELNVFPTYGIKLNRKHTKPMPSSKKIQTKDECSFCSHCGNLGKISPENAFIESNIWGKPINSSKIQMLLQSDEFKNLLNMSV